jgi:hypothetical protein
VEGRGVCPSWAKSKPEGPNGRKERCMVQNLGALDQPRVTACVTLK